MGVNNSTTLVINNSDNVGIGTDSPQVPLQIGTHLTTAPADTGLTVSNRKSIRINDADGSYSFGVYIKQNYSGSSYLILGTRHNAIDTDALFVKSGNVGIGADSPNAKLQVNGDIRAENSSFLAGREDASAPAHSFHDDADTGMFNINPNILGFSTGGTERMRIDSSGGVSITPTTSTSLFYGADGTNSYINFETNNIDATVQLYAGYSSGGYFAIGTKDSGGTLSERMRIDSSGQVKITSTGSTTNDDTAIKFDINSTNHIKQRITTTSTGGYQASLELESQGNAVSISTAGSNEIRFNTSASERMRIDSSGNATFQESIIFNNGAPYSSAASIRQQSNSLIFSGGSDGYYFNKSDNSVTHFRIDPSGNVGIGGTPNNFTNQKSLTINGIAGGNSRLDFQINGTNEAEIVANDASLIIAHNDILKFYTAATERMRITSGGYVQAGNFPNDTIHEFAQKTTNAQWTMAVRNTTALPYGLLLIYDTSPNNADQYPLYFTDATTARFYMTSNGAIYNNGTYGTISDRKLKENIIDATPKLDDINKLKVRNFNFKDNTEEKHIGFIAQEFEEVFPKAIENTQDRDEDNNLIEDSYTKTIKTSILIPMLVKSIQELKAEVDKLKQECKCKN
tara:strand:+ start:1 stop:1881 length:1881 start_codon:yes stop_codon:yes gene_type:complete